MSQQADIEASFKSAIRGGDMGSERDLLSLQLDVYESLDWDIAAKKLANEMKDEGYPVPCWYE